MTPAIKTTLQETFCSKFSMLNKTQETAYPKRFSHFQQIYTEKKAYANWRASDKCGNREILRRSSSSFTAPKLNIGFAASRRFCFAPVISLKTI